MWQLRDVTLDSIGGFLAVYLLLGVGWTHLYALVEAVEPGAFFTRSIDGSSHRIIEYTSGTYPQLFFFSFVTLTTLGYGDILPVSSAAKGLAIAEAIGPADHAQPVDAVTAAHLEETTAQISAILEAGYQRQ